ncbi:MAG: amino acid kinase [Methanosarcinaceae archaeon]|nr:amino acid kinase [Methanosarcinaceae archaeon]MDD4749774.1 amino acid kinase [Methanosarcinaceae archaeon]
MKVVVKIGGSLIKEAPDLIKMLLERFSERASILIVPGGGPFADAIRVADTQFGIGNEAAHWMAILSMEQYAYYLMDKSGAKGTSFPENPEKGVKVLLPYNLIKETDPLSHSWTVTSDSLAAWVARRMGAKFVKVTDVDGVFRNSKLLKEISAFELSQMKFSCTDSALPAFLLENRMDCLVVNGKFPERVAGALFGKPVLGTVVKGNI